MICHDYQRQWILSEREDHVPPDVREHVAGCIECQNFLRDSEQLRTHLRALGESEAAPESLRRRTEKVVRGAPGERVKPLRRWIKVAAAIVLVALVAYGVRHYFERRSGIPERLAEEFISDHLHYLPGREQIVSSSAQQVEDWFKGRVDFPVRVPAVPGAALEDGRVCDIAGRKAALLHYRRKPDDALVSLFMAEEPKVLEQQQQPVALSASMHGVNSTLWCHRGIVYDIVGALDDASLKQMAETVQKQEP